MPNRNYETGRRFEYKVKKHLESKGYFVLRSAGSKSPIDLIAVNKHDGYVMMVQCKYGNKPAKAEVTKLIEMQKEMVWVDIVIAHGKPRERIQLLFLDNGHIGDAP